MHIIRRRGWTLLPLSGALLLLKQTELQKHTRRDKKTASYEKVRELVYYNE